MFGLPQQYTYLILMLLSVAYPFAQSFEKRITLYKSWKFIFPAIIITNLVFIPWDVFFTVEEFWGFNSDFITGIKIWHLPIEEWLFFFLIPYCCFFVYFVANYFIKTDILFNQRRNIGWVVFAILIVVGALNFPKWYTSTAFLGAAAWLLMLLITKFDFFLGRFWVAYLLCLIPFIIVNGQLTYPPVVWYNDAENLGVRLFVNGFANIPIDDLAYNLLLLLMNISIYHFFEQRSKR